MDTKLEDIWRIFEDRLKSFILSRIPDEMDAEDILQEVFIKIHARIDTLKDDSKTPARVAPIPFATAIIRAHASPEES